MAFWESFARIMTRIGEAAREFGVSLARGLQQMRHRREQLELERELRESED